MPVPDPTPTAAQLVTVAEIMLVPADQVLGIVSADSDQEFSDAKWAATLADIANWPSFAFGKRRIKKVDSIEFFDNGVTFDRLEFRNSLRRRYGLVELLTDDNSVTEIVYSTPSTPTGCC